MLIRVLQKGAADRASVTSNRACHSMAAGSLLYELAGDLIVISIIIIRSMSAGRVRALLRLKVGICTDFLDVVGAHRLIGDVRLEELLMLQLLSQRVFDIGEPLIDNLHLLLLKLQLLLHRVGGVITVITLVALMSGLALRPRCNGRPRLAYRPATLELRFEVTNVLGDGLITELWQGELLPGEATLFTFSSTAELESRDQVICASSRDIAEITPDITPWNNSKCTVSTISSDFELLPIQPNPASNQIQVSVMSDDARTVIIQLYDNAGRICFESVEIDLQEGYSSFDVDVSQYRPGYYTLAVGDAEIRKTQALMVSREK